MKKMLMTEVSQYEVNVLDPTDDPDYEKNVPPGGDWKLVEYPDGKRLWTPNHNYKFNTAKIEDFGKLELKEGNSEKG